jgi:hypothetical protein
LESRVFCAPTAMAGHHLGVADGDLGFGFAAAA